MYFAVAQTAYDNERENHLIRKDVGLSNFTHKATKMWNDLPESIRVQQKMKKFKMELKVWIKSNVDL